MVLSKENTNKIIYRSPYPAFVPKGLLECEGVVANVVFPSGIDRRDDLGAPERFDVYYGMADHRIGVARLDVPATLPHGAAACRSHRRRTRLSYVAFARRAGAGCVGPRAGSRQTGTKMPVGRQDAAAATPNIAAVAVANKNGSWRTLKARRLIDQATLTALKSRLARTASI